MRRNRACEEYVEEYFNLLNPGVVLAEHNNCPLTLVPSLDFFFMSISIVSGQEEK